jgi:hypothetical protein
MKYIYLSVSDYRLIKLKCQNYRREGCTYLNLGMITLLDILYSRIGVPQYCGLLSLEQQLGSIWLKVSKNMKMCTSKNNT